MKTKKRRLSGKPAERNDYSVPGLLDGDGEIVALRELNNLFEHTPGDQWGRIIAFKIFGQLSRTSRVRCLLNAIRKATARGEPAPLVIIDALELQSNTRPSVHESKRERERFAYIKLMAEEQNTKDSEAAKRLHVTQSLIVRWTKTPWIEDAIKRFRDDLSLLETLPEGLPLTEP
jgi:hypothetical protein